MFRVVLGLVFFVVSTTLIALSTMSIGTPAIREVLGNVGTEIFGIMVTIALVDWVLEKRRQQDRGRELAWSVLHAIEHAVWVWQGGPRHMGTNELLGMVTGIQKKESCQPYTEGLLMNVGLQCRSILQREPSTVRSLPGLGEAMEDLVSLASIPDLPKSTRIRTVAEILEASVMGLSRVLGQSTDRMPSGLLWYRDPSPQGQETRYRQIGPGAFAPNGAPGPGIMPGANGDFPELEPFPQG